MFIVIFAGYLLFDPMKNLDSNLSTPLTCVLSGITLPEKIYFFILLHYEYSEIYDSLRKIKNINMGRKFGFSFSWKRASGLSAAKTKLSKAIGVPLTKQGRQRKYGSAMGCATLIGVLVILPTVVFATSGACSGHSGVNCSAGPDTDGSVICNDGWFNSSVQFSSMVMCEGTNQSVPVLEPVPTPTPTPVVTSVPMPIPDPTSSSSFSDVPTFYKYAAAIIFVKDDNIVSGYPDGTFKPENKINRAEFTKILVNYQFPNADLTLHGCFSDVSGWSEPYICYAKQKGIIDGYPDGTFKPEQSITVPEVLKISLLATQGAVTGDSSGVWYEKYVNFADSHGLKLSEWTSLGYQITRGEMAELIDRINSVK